MTDSKTDLIEVRVDVPAWFFVPADELDTFLATVDDCDEGDDLLTFSPSEDRWGVPHTELTIGKKWKSALCPWNSTYAVEGPESA